MVELAITEWIDGQDGDQYKRFTAACDQEFSLRAEGQSDVRAFCEVGSITGGGVHSCVLSVDRAAMTKGVAYKLVPRNRDAVRKWIVAPGVSLTR